MTYADAAALVFGSKPFTTREFGHRTGSPRAAKTLSELKRRGLVQRVGRGRYRYLDADEREDPRAEEHRRVHAAIRDAPMSWAFEGPSAVEVWTGYRYYVAAAPLLRRFYIVVPAGSLAKWRDYLRARRISSSTARRLGTAVVIRSARRMPPIETVQGERVITREAALDLVRSNRAAYAEADRIFLKRARRP